MRFELGKPVAHDETRQLEFKAVSSKNPVRTIADKSDEYAVAFLNSSGGKIVWGVRDNDKVVEGVPLTAANRDELRRVVTDKLNNIEPKIDPTRFKLEIKSVRGDLCVVSLTVPKGVGGPFYASGKHAYVRLDGANKLLSGPQLTAWITDRAPKGKAKAAPEEFVPIEIYHHGDKLPSDFEVVWDFRTWSNTRASMAFDFHLPAQAAARRKEKFGIVTSSFFTAMADWWSGRHTPIALPDGRHLFTSDKMVLNLIPGDWHKYSLTGEFLEPVVDRREEIAFRFFTDRGPIDVPFAVRMLGIDIKTTLRNERLALSRLKAADLAQ